MNNIQIYLGANLFLEKELRHWGERWV